ncbi:MAG: cytochrome c biogenesis protein CcdA [Candidatus Margulisiibacteriota bacterium]
MLEIFSALSCALYSNPYIATAAAFVWGILSILLSPCHLASIPLIVALINGTDNINTRKAFSLSLLFSLGILVTIASIGLVTGLAGRMLGDVGVFGNYLVAAIFFLIGLYLFDLVWIPFSLSPNNVLSGRKGLFAAFFVGLVFGVALGPCSFAYMAPILGIAFTSGAKDLGFSLILIFSYAAGHCSVIVVAGTFTEAVQRYLNWNKASKASFIIKRICGTLIILAGIFLLFR